MTEKIVSQAGTFLVEFAKNAAGDPLFPAPNLLYQSGRAEVMLNQPKLWTHVFQSYDRQTYLDLSQYINANAIPKVWLRYGVTSGDDGRRTEWEPQTIISISALTSRTGDSAHGDFFTLITADLLYVMQKDARVAARKGRVSAMVQTIASAAGFEKFAIEPTDLDYALIQTFQSDFDFVVNRLLPLASNKETSSNYLFFQRGELFHFHTLNYQLSGLFQFDYGLTTNSGLDVTIANFGNRNDLSSNNGVKLVAYDPLAGTTTNWETKPERELVLSDYAPTRSATSYQVSHVGQNQLASLYAESQWRYATDKVGMYELGFTVANFPYVNLGDVVTVSIQRGLGDPWEGLYMVRQLTHTIETSRVLTRYALIRGEYLATTGKTAEGKKLNADAVAASSVASPTSGGFKTGGGNVVEVNNPSRR